MVFDLFRITIGVFAHLSLFSWFDFMYYTAFEILPLCMMLVILLYRPPQRELATDRSALLGNRVPL